MPCIVPGCGNTTRSPYSGREGAVCGVHWFRLTLKTRQAWWKATDYGKQPPPRELVAQIVDELKDGQGSRKTG
jgi:hypothetical protein